MTVALCQMDPHGLVRFSLTFDKITLMWPPDPKTKTLGLMAKKFMWYLCVVSYIWCFVSIFVTIRGCDEDPVVVSKSISDMSISGDACLQLILVRMQWPRFEILRGEVMSFLKTARRDERNVCRKYIKRYLIYYIGLCVTGIATAVICLMGPLLLVNRRFPVDTWIPFDTDPIFNRSGVYCFQYIMILHCLTLLSGDFMMFTLLWCSTARLELLGIEFQKIEDAFHLRNCARKHQEIIRFVRETECAIRLLVIKNFFGASITLLCAGLQLTNNRSLTVLSQFFFLICVVSVRLFGFTWAVDDLTEMGRNLAWSIYQSPAASKSFQLGKSVSIVIQRSQRRLGITMWGTSLALSLEFFTTFVLRVMSFFMTLRVVVDRYV